MIYIRLQVWNYDASPRSQFINSQVKTKEQGLRFIKAINQSLFQGKQPGGRFLDKRHGIYGHITGVVGMYRRTEEKLA